VIGANGAPVAGPTAGRLDEHVFASEALRGNPLGDPSERPLWVYVPPGYDEPPERRYPSVYLLQGYTGSIDMWRNRSPWRPTYPEAADALFAAGDAPGCILVFLDAWTRYGGSQFVDSPGTGRYHTYLCDEIVPWVDARYRTLDAPAHRGLQGKSSGGFGTMITAMLRPDLFGGLATHAGDALYELCYVKGFADCARALRDHYDGSYERFWADFSSRPAMSRQHDGDLAMTYAVAACFSADDDGTVRLPFDVATGRLIDDVWERWLAWDPVRMVADHAAALRSQRAIWIDAGTRDEWFLDLGAEAFRRELEAIGITDVHFELFDATHMAIDYRYPLALRYLAQRLSPAVD
jgi:S-formylglutathione hydrolase FrmB